MARKTFSTRRYENSHGRTPRGFGNWMFENAAGEQVTHNGTYAEAKTALPDGNWIVLP